MLQLLFVERQGGFVSYISSFKDESQNQSTLHYRVITNLICFMTVLYSVFIIPPDKQLMAYLPESL